jgi:hypothetical protein
MEMHEQQGLQIEQNELRKAKERTNAEKILAIAALAIAVLFDRLLVNNLGNFFDGDGWHAVFWLGYLVIFYALFWQRVKKDVVLWIISGCVVALCVWNFIPFTSFEKDPNWQFYFFTSLVIPAVLMVHAQWTAKSFLWKMFDGAVYAMFISWFEGWFIKPFTAVGELFSVTGSMVSDETKPIIKRAALGFLIVFFMMLIIIPLLMGADQMFGHHVTNILEQLSISKVIFHGIVVAIAFGLFYSFLWNIGYGDNSLHEHQSTGKADKIISTIVLSSTILVYVLFCAVQFTYLFARTGLPSHMTYSEYAREGFAQTVTVCAINIFIYLVFLWRGEKCKCLTILLASLLALTGIMLFSGAVRLNLYIAAYGMTWLRLLSAWFIIYLAAVTLLSFIRLFKENMPLVAICSLLLLIWYIALGYLNPDGFMHWYNIEMEFPQVVPTRGPYF